MRIEDVLHRYLPAGGRVVDRRPEAQRGPMSFAAEAAIEVQYDVAPDAAITVTDAADLEPQPVSRPLTLVTVAAPATELGPLPDVLAWASDQGGQVVEITRLLAPSVTAVVVRHEGPAEVPAVPGRAEPIPATEATWKRLAGELLYERHRAAVRDGELDRLRTEVAKLKRSLKRTPAAEAAPPRRHLLPPMRLRHRRPGGDGD